MKQEIIPFNSLATRDNTIVSFIRFEKFIEFLVTKAATENSSRAKLYRLVLDSMHSFPGLTEGTPIGDAAHYGEIMELVAAVLFPLAEDENETFMAIANPSSLEVFYSTNAFYQLFTGAADIPSPQSWINDKEKLERHRHFQCNLILKTIYGKELPAQDGIVHGFVNPLTGLHQYYRVNVDTRFVDVQLKPGMDMPDGLLINSLFDQDTSIDKIENILPLAHFTANGFCIISLTDVTAQQAVEQMGKAVLRIDTEYAADDFKKITHLLQTIVGSNQYRFGIMPFFSINKRAALPYENFNFSILVKTCFEAGISKTVFARYLNSYTQKPVSIIYLQGTKTNVLPVPVEQALETAGIHYYALLPVYLNEMLVGIFEIASGKGVAPLNELQGNSLKLCFPYLSQLMHVTVENFNAAIDAIIKDKFTNIQPAVQWKFNEVAWHYYRSRDIERRNDELENISFKEVYPLYGAVDIRNSTVERNRTLREDLQYQLELLIDLLNGLYESGQDEKMQQLAEQCREWIVKMEDYVSVEAELELNDFLYRQVHPTLNSVEAFLKNELKQKREFYYSAIDENKGQAYLKRRQLENSMKTLNKVVGQYFDLFANELQTDYPCYFEKFRTDGVEYDIYIGQSIAPHIPFFFQHVERLRFWQLQSMAAITKLTHLLQPQLEYPLQTTQLIFVNARSIDISFRNDERRFDVEGTYNIRYHIVKKRIDKVHIKNTSERLTQPGKIAIVYFNEKDATGYVNNIYQLQEDGILLKDLEYLELEELQGVAGLKALRVGVTL